MKLRSLNCCLKMNIKSNKSIAITAFKKQDYEKAIKALSCEFSLKDITYFTFNLMSSTPPYCTYKLAMKRLKILIDKWFLAFENDNKEKLNLLNFDFKNLGKDIKNLDIKRFINYIEAHLYSCVFNNGKCWLLHKSIYNLYPFYLDTAYENWQESIFIKVYCELWPNDKKFKLLFG